jgi:hypothetical protein
MDESYRCRETGETTAGQLEKYSLRPEEEMYTFYKISEISLQHKNRSRNFLYNPNVLQYVCYVRWSRKWIFLLTHNS